MSERKFPISLQKLDKTLVILRDDKLPGGTKSIYVHDIIDRNPAAGYLFSTPPEGGYQIALATACKERGKKCVIVTAKRKIRHGHTNEVIQLGGTIVEVDVCAFQSHLEKVGREYVERHPDHFKIEFGANYEYGIDAIAWRMATIKTILGREPKQIFCAVGSGTLLKGILRATKRAQIIAVLVGKDHTLEEFDHQDRVTLIRHRLKYQQALKLKDNPFPANATYEAKAFETLLSMRDEKALTLFWNVYK